MNRTDWKALAPYLAPYFDIALRDRGIFQRFWIAENGFPNRRSYGSIEDAAADVKSRIRAGVQYQSHDDGVHESIMTKWVCSGTRRMNDVDLRAWLADFLEGFSDYQTKQIHAPNHRLKQPSLNRSVKRS